MGAGERNAVEPGADDDYRSVAKNVLEIFEIGSAIPLPNESVFAIGATGRRSTQQIAELADADGRVVVTKDRDFRDGHLLARSRDSSSSSPQATSRTTRSWRSSRCTSTRSSPHSIRPTSSSYPRMRWCSGIAAKTPNA
jgi:hypothetical protein